MSFDFQPSSVSCSLVSEDSESSEPPAANEKKTKTKTKTKSSRKPQAKSSTKEKKKKPSIYIPLPIEQVESENSFLLEDEDEDDFDEEFEYVYEEIEEEDEYEYDEDDEELDGEEEEEVINIDTLSDIGPQDEEEEEEEEDTFSVYSLSSARSLGTWMEDTLNKAIEQKKKEIWERKQRKRLEREFRRMQKKNALPPPRSISEVIYPSRRIVRRVPQTPISITSKPSDKSVESAKEEEESKSASPERTVEDEIAKMQPKGPELPEVGIVPILLSRLKQIGEDSKEEIRRLRTPIRIPKKKVDKKKTILTRSCQFDTPGPGTYHVYTSLGIKGDDPTKKRAPCFSLGYKRPPPPTVSSKIPGPSHYYIEDVTRKGVTAVRGHTFGWRRPVLQEEISPLGPGEYRDQTASQYKKIPYAMMHGRPKETKRLITQGVISKLSCFGKKNHFPPMLGKPKLPRPNNYPPPNAYLVTDVNVYKRRFPSYTMGMQRPMLSKYRHTSPPVGYYYPNYDFFKKKQDILFGKKPNRCVIVPMDLPEKFSTEELN